MREIERTWEPLGTMERMISDLSITSFELEQDAILPLLSETSLFTV